MSRPSPSLVVAILALVLALTGTAFAATKVLIHNSKQIATGAIKGSDIADHTITVRDLHPDAVPSATEAARKKTGVFHPGEQRIATLTLQPGVYAVFAKTTIGPPGEYDPGLLGALLKDPKTGGAALCRLNAAGDEDVAIGTVQTPGTAGPVTLQMQLTRTLDKPGDATLSCHVGDVDWQASDTSIIAMKLARSSRSDVTG
jgi:hypothetical protein